MSEVDVNKPCPFCGTRLDLNDRDILYPSGVGWKEEEGMRVGCDVYDVPKEQWCYKIVCQEHYGGCGAEMHGYSIEDTIKKWNKRV